MHLINNDNLKLNKQLPEENKSHRLHLITDDYLKLNKQLHEENKSYGANGSRWAKHLSNLIHVSGVKTILDYGCGKGSLYFSLKDMVKEYQNYDPCVEEFSKEPHSAQLVICTDVMEHIEPELTDNVLADINSKCENVVFFNISLKPAVKTLPDGRNTHINLRHINWWVRKLICYFEVLEIGLVSTEGEDKGYQSFCFTGQLLK